MQIKGTELFVKALIAEGVDTLFAYPGGQVIPIFDALYQQDAIDVILPRHEQALVHAADGYARSTGKVGVCLVTSGPGATNAVTGIATANFDSVPLVCFTGQVPTKLIGNDAFQEVDIAGITRGITKYNTVIRDRADVARVIKEAFYIARTGKPGVVLVDLPVDVMNALGDDTYPDEVNIRSYKPVSSVHMGQLKRAVALLNEARRPVILAGGGVKLSGAGPALTELMEQTHIPVATTLMGKGVVPSSSPYSLGFMGMHGYFAANMAINDCDLLFSIGTRFNDRITGDVKRFAPHAKIIHIDIDAASISRNIQVDIPIVADAKRAILAMKEMVEPQDMTPWNDEINAWRAQHPMTMGSAHTGLTPQCIIETVNTVLPDSIVVTDVGQHQMWAAQYTAMSPERQFLTSGGLGTMGFGLPAAIGAQIGNRDKTVVCFSGDGGMQMNSQELATAVCQEANVITIVFNNSYLGMVRQWQELFWDKHYSGTCLRRRRSCQHICADPSAACPPYTPDFVKLAESYGALGLRVFAPEELIPALEQAKAANTPAVIECILEPEVNVYPMVPGGKALNEMILEGMDK